MFSAFKVKYLFTIISIIALSIRWHRKYIALCLYSKGYLIAANYTTTSSSGIILFICHRVLVYSSGFKMPLTIIVPNNK